MNLDLRFPIGLLFLIFGMILTVFGIVSDNSIYERSFSININFWWGIALVIFGSVFLILSYRGRKSKD